MPPIRYIVLVDPHFLLWVSIQDQKASSMDRHPQKWFGLVPILLHKNQLAMRWIPYKVPLMHVSYIFYRDAPRSLHPPPQSLLVHKLECGSTYWVYSHPNLCSISLLLRRLFLKQVQDSFSVGNDSSRKLRIYVPVKAHLQQSCAICTLCETMLYLFIQSWGGISAFRFR